MKVKMKNIFIFILLSAFSFSIYAEEEQAGNSSSGKKELSDEELGVVIGRYGEVDEVPADFKFADAENKLWLSDHLGNIEKPISLYYEFIKSGSFEEGFSDSVYLKILEVNDDGTKNALLDFLLLSVNNLFHLLM